MEYYGIVFLNFCGNPEFVCKCGIFWSYVYTFFMVKDVDHLYLLASVKSSHSGQLTRTKKSVSLRNSSKYPTNITVWHSKYVECNLNKNLAESNAFSIPPQHYVPP